MFDGSVAMGLPRGWESSPSSSPTANGLSPVTHTTSGGRGEPLSFGQDVDTVSYSQLIEIRDVLLERARLTVVEAWTEDEAAANEVQAKLDGRRVFPEEFTALLLERRGTSTNEKAVRDSAQHYMMGLQRHQDGTVDVDEWVHHMLLRYSSTACSRAILEMKALLETAMLEDVGALEGLVATYELARRPKFGRPGLTATVQMLSEKLWHCTKLKYDPAINDQLPVARRFVGACELCGADAQTFASIVASCVVLDSDEIIGYLDFIAYFLGRPQRSVSLNMYDLTNGKASAVTPWLPMQGLGLPMRKLDALWHTGLVVFEWEYFYCGNLFCDVPGKTVFGTPKTLVHLGYTHRHRGELHHFIIAELKQLYTRDTYDALRHNCNHFSDCVSRWLCGRGIPANILKLQDQLLESPLTRLLWPFLKSPMVLNCLGCTSMLSWCSDSSSAKTQATVDAADEIQAERSAELCAGLSPRAPQRWHAAPPSCDAIPVEQI